LINDIIEKISHTISGFNIDVDNTETDFITENNIDSITFIEIIISIEEEFSILIPEDYLLMENLNTISKMANIIQKMVDVNQDEKCIV
jgi:acyl carrier protein